MPVCFSRGGGHKIRYSTIGYFFFKNMVLTTEIIFDWAHVYRFWNKILQRAYVSCQSCMVVCDLAFVNQFANGIVCLILKLWPNQRKLHKCIFMSNAEKIWSMHINSNNLNLSTFHWHENIDYWLLINIFYSFLISKGAEHC